MNSDVVLIRMERILRRLGIEYEVDENDEVTFYSLVEPIYQNTFYLRPQENAFKLSVLLGRIEEHGKDLANILNFMMYANSEKELDTKYGFFNYDPTHDEILYSICSIPIVWIDSEGSMFLKYLGALYKIAIICEGLIDRLLDGSIDFNDARQQMKARKLAIETDRPEELIKATEPY